MEDTGFLIPIPVTSEMLERARAKAADLGNLRNSITKGDGNVAGFLGEEALLAYLGTEASPVNTRNYDVIFRGWKIDAKTKRRKSAPREDYDCSVAAYNTGQKCDIYVFASVTYDCKMVHLCGWMPHDEYYEHATAMEEGQQDSNIVNGKKYEFHADCYNMKYFQLKRMEDLKNLAKLEPKTEGTQGNISKAS